MESVTEQLAQAAEDIKLLVQTLHRDHSHLERDWNVNNRNSDIYVMSPSGDYKWHELTAVGKQLQSRAREEYTRFLDILRTLLRGQAAAVLKEVEGAAEAVFRLIDQNHLTWCKTTEEAIGKLTQAIDAQVEQLDRLYDGSEGSHIYVPDTNALLHNPNMEDWEFDGSPRIELALTPTVISELDQLKVNHRNENVRNKAEGLVRRIKGYRTRGRLTEGVPLRSSRSTLRTIAVEPDIGASLPWIRPENADDRILASFIEVMRQHPRSVVLLVTRDMNLQNKAEFARLPFVEPPDGSP